MSKHHSIMSEDFKYELAKELGVYDVVKSEGWGSVSSRQCGNLVTAAIRYAEKLYEQQNNGMH
ncbi:spore protein [Fervidicella metallireducens AeB]|uniref:Spore protein n=2 Tax=Fervidicella TaxID=1403538 RepID=A0A017RYN7_9CLOT|nr:small, acid-soluble spore protein, alpha/beta type [Fervidicella metallireducens]EYE89792.1 spore protein [Fervidicella metallireducens AeB]